MKFIDSHCHLDLDAFDGDRGQVIDRSSAAGVERIVVPATTPESWERLLKLAETFSALRIAFGIHPYFLDDIPESALTELRRMIAGHRARIVAIGETGLDKMIEVDFEKQQFFFAKQLEMAEEFGLPVIIHSRRAHDRVVAMVRRSSVRRGVVHGFAGSYQQGAAFWKLGLRLGVGGVITYERARKTRNAVAQMPVEALLLETDAPDMPLSGRQGERNSPEFVPEVFSCLVGIRREEPDLLHSQILENTRQLFSLA
ncbi:hypothetical protein BTA51_18580 [Hahella sp. CCB-MM4]|uniref:TatD family hydrolase n=1 Tax=Hahella sp. (strain CCB-MM4) TaxID=1926491 RepID=UPI000B9BA134|nr:TatD family hydrolase [Hahella sp. CCB-MM4]OZG72005.1 hypothetical protein BTA51_18580 [Hahella sp. CCB-MM4]